MSTINCIVVDDSRLDRLVVEDLLLPYADFKLVGSCSNPLESIEMLKHTNIQVMFIDIDMPVMNGVDFFKTLREPPACVFITAHGEYALDAFELHAFDYIMKPVRQERFADVIRRLRDYFFIRQKALQYEMFVDNDKITIKEGNSLNKVLCSEIIYLEALTNYTRVVTVSRKYTTLCNLKNFTDSLPPGKFIRIHRSYTVAVEKIDRVEQGTVVLGNIKLPVGKTYRQPINAAMVKRAV